MKNITWSWDEPNEDERKDEIDFPECLAEDLLQAELEMQALDDDIEAKMQQQRDSQADQNYYAQCAAEGYVPGEHDRSCCCPECEGDPDGLDGVGQIAWEEYQAKLSYADKDIIASGNSEEFCGEF